MYKLQVEFLLPSWDAFVLGASRLGSDMLGPPEFTQGKWITVTCDTGDIKIEQSYSEQHPLSIYETGIAQITMKGANWAPSVNPDVLPGVRVRISALQEEVLGPFSEQYANQFLSTGIPETKFLLFYGYVLDVDEDWTGEPDYPKSMVLTAVDEWHKIVKLDGDTTLNSVSYNNVDDLLRGWGVNALQGSGTDTRTISRITNTQQDIERAVYTVAGSAYVIDDTVMVYNHTVWEDKPPTHKISDVHIGPHLCYTGFDKRSRLTNVMNQIEQTNITVVGGEEVSTLTVFMDAASVEFYGKSGHRVTTALAGGSWPGDTYLTAGRYPEARTRSVDVELRPDNITLLPHIQDCVEFTYRGATENRRVAGRTLHFTPDRWEATIKFFDFILFEPSTTPLRVIPQNDNTKELIAV